MNYLDSPHLRLANHFQIRTLVLISTLLQHHRRQLPPVRSARRRKGAALTKMVGVRELRDRKEVLTIRMNRSECSVLPSVMWLVYLSELLFYFVSMFTPPCIWIEPNVICLWSPELKIYILTFSILIIDFSIIKHISFRIPVSDSLARKRHFHSLIHGTSL